MLSTRDVLLQQRHKCMDRIREKLGGSGARLIAELESIDTALASLSPRGARQYAGYRRAIEAIIASLTIHDHAMTPEDLSEDIIDGGWLSTDDRARFNVLDSIDYHTRRKGHGRKKNIIRAMGRLIGLYEWPDEKFGVLDTPPENAKFKIGERVKTEDSSEIFVVEQAKATAIPDDPVIYGVRSEKDGVDTRFLSENDLHAAKSGPHH